MNDQNSRIPLPMDDPDRATKVSTQPFVPPPAPGPSDSGLLKETVISALKTCFDPEVPVNIYELGLIYDIEVSPERSIAIKMTLTSPACPVAGSLPGEVQAKITAIPGVSQVAVSLVWDPPWTPERMTEAAKLQLGMF